MQPVPPPLSAPSLSTNLGPIPPVLSSAPLFPSYSATSCFCSFAATLLLCLCPSSSPLSRPLPLCPASFPCLAPPSLRLSPSQPLILGLQRVWRNPKFECLSCVGAVRRATPPRALLRMRAGCACALTSAAQLCLVVPASGPSGHGVAGGWVAESQVAVGQQGPLARPSM